MSQSHKLLTIATEAARMARVMATTTPITSTKDKGDRDIVTNLDLAIEDAVGSFLARKTPHIGFLGEEGSDRPPHQMRWVIDPIDGTGNLVHGVPFYGTAVSLIDGGRTTVAVIDLPPLGDTYTAFSGSQARLNGNVIKCGEATELGEAMIGISEFARGEGAKQKNEQMLRITDALSYEAQHVRIIGSAITTLAWVADGRLDAAIIMSNRTWDTSAGVLIAQRAGAKAWDLNGRPHTIDSDSVVVTSPGIEAELLGLLQRAMGNKPADASHSVLPPTWPGQQPTVELPNYQAHISSTELHRRLFLCSSCRTGAVGCRGARG